MLVLMLFMCSLLAARCLLCVGLLICCGDDNMTNRHLKGLYDIFNKKIFYIY